MEAWGVGRTSLNRTVIDAGGGRRRHRNHNIVVGRGITNDVTMMVDVVHSIVNTFLCESNIIHGRWGITNTFLCKVIITITTVVIAPALL
jgi:hypothetical protein